MIDFKHEIINAIKKAVDFDISEQDLHKYIEKPKNSANGDYAFPCFSFAKQLKKSPQEIAENLKQKIKISPEYVQEIKVSGPYLNFYINKITLTQEVLNEISKNQENYGKSKIGEGKTIVIDYSAPNIAKPFHIGHLKTTVIGGALYNIYKYLGYNTIGENFLGDYGTQFGKLIEGYKRWGKDYDLTQNPIDKLGEIYKRINDLCSEDEQVLEAAREDFKQLENGKEEYVELWKKFRDVSIKEFQKIYDLLGSHFDSWKGEAFYATKTDEVIQILQDSGRLVESNGAKVVDLTDEGIDTPCIICKSNGSTIYATRDLAAILYRARTYDFDKCLYVTSYEQNLHFKQIFAVAKLLGIKEKCIKGLKHVSYGMVRLPSGKMSTRAGNFVKVEDLLHETIEEAKKIIEEKNPDLSNKEEVAKKVGIGAVIFNSLATSRNKDEIFDIKAMLNFQGETGPYIQYMYVRTKSVLEKIENMPKFEQLKLENLQDEYSIAIIKLLYDFENILVEVTEKEEPSILARYVLDLAKAYSVFYNENRIIVEDEEVKNARVYLTACVSKVLKIGANLLGIDMPNKM